jgi:cytochrome c5
LRSLSLPTLSLRRSVLSTTAGIVLALSAPAAALAQSPEGEATYQRLCVACHGSGAAGAPRTGDRKVWSKLIAEGQTVLTAHGYVGIRGMPARGGQADLELEPFAAAVVYMAKQAGAPWRDPDARQLQAMRQEIAQREKQLAAKGAKK